VWALDVDPAERRLVVGAADAELHCYRLLGGAAPGAAGAAGAPGQASAAGGGAGARGDLLEDAGGLRRAAIERVAALRFDAGGRLLAVQGAGRVLEVFRRGRARARLVRLAGPMHACNPAILCGPGKHPGSLHSGLPPGGATVREPELLLSGLLLQAGIHAGM